MCHLSYREIKDQVIYICYLLLFVYLHFVSLGERHLGHIVGVGSNLELTSLNKIVLTFNN